MSNPVIIKKYANRRLYNTQTSSYITLDDLSKMVRDGVDFEVVDAKTGHDLTRQVLAQIIFEEETKGAAMLPMNFLRHMIRFYDDSMQQVLPHYLEVSMDMFAENQGKIRQQFDQMFGPFSPFKTMKDVEELQRKNMEFFHRTVQAFNPFAFPQTPGDKDQKIADLTQEIATLNKEIEKLKRQAKR